MKKYIHRQLEQKIKTFLKRPEILVITGPRQAGKTTLLNYFYKELKEKKQKVKFLTFENISDLELFEKDIEGFKKLYSSYKYLFIDEFQYAKDGGKKLKYLFDTTKTKFIISGSSSLEINFQLKKYLVGRALYFQLYPFSFREFLSAKSPDLFGFLEKELPFEKVFQFKSSFLKKKFSDPVVNKIEKKFNEYLIWGGYPAVVLSKTKEEKKKVLDSIVSSYLLKDIKGVLNLATEKEILLLSRALALQIGNLIEYEELGTFAGLKHRELKKHLNILEETYITKFISPFFRNKRTELVKNPKVYFVDNGFRNSLISNFNSPDKRTDSGQLAENYFLSSSLRFFSEFDCINYWRTKSGAEVDFIIQKNHQIIPVEIKFSYTPSIGKSMYSFIDKYRPKLAIILTRSTLDYIKIKNVRIFVLPLWYF